jgi:hypothetical protein
LEKEAASPIGQRKELVTELGDREDYIEMYCGMECVRCEHNYIITPHRGVYQHSWLINPSKSISTMHSAVSRALVIEKEIMKYDKAAKQ